MESNSAGERLDCGPMAQTHNDAIDLDDDPIAALKAAREAGDSEGVARILARMKSAPSELEPAAETTHALDAMIAGLHLPSSPAPLATEEEKSWDSYTQDALVKEFTPVAECTVEPIEKLAPRDDKHDLVDVVNIDEITVDERFNVRGPIDIESEEFQAFKGSIETSGLLEPLVVWHQPEGPIGGVEERLYLIAGFRRHMALTLLGVKEVQVKVIPPTTLPVDAELINLTENVAREDLRPWQVAEKCFRFQEIYVLNLQDIAARVGLSYSYIGMLIRLHTRLHPKLLAIFRGTQCGKHTTTYSDLVRLVSIHDKTDQLAAWEKLQAKKEEMGSWRGPRKTGRKSDRERAGKLLSPGKLERLIRNVKEIKSVRGVEGDLVDCERAIIRKVLRFVAGMDRSPFIMKK